MVTSEFEGPSIRMDHLCYLYTSIEPKFLVAPIHTTEAFTKILSICAASNYSHLTLGADYHDDIGDPPKSRYAV